MKRTKLMAAGLAAVMMFAGAVTVYADDTAAVSADTQTEVREMPAADMMRQAVRKMFGMPEAPEEEMDLSELELPEGFVPFDEEHVPDGQNAPANGELKPIEFDEDGNMIFGQKPDGEMPELPEGAEAGERPELPEGAEEGERPELPEGAEEGERPELPEGAEAGERPELPEGAEQGEMPPMRGGQPGGMMQPDGQMPPTDDGTQNI